MPFPQLDDTSKNALYAAAFALGGGLVAWIGLAIRRAIKGEGKVSVEIAQARLDEAIKAQEAAKGTPDGADDLAAEKALAAAKTALEHAKRLQAIADAIGDTDTPTKP